ncbi:MAG: pilus assembly protein [Selenomonadaceae bacterium]|nr:pilus assembly protein [Selenomonadaceae bacterium]
MNLHEKFKSACKRLNQHGQSLVLYAIAFPMLFMFVFVGVDMGWYYLNVSRLQNAADAATIAGANTLKSTNDLTNVKKILLVDEFFNKEDEKDSITDLINANVAATDYANKNLNETAESGDIAEDKVNAITNSWTHEPVKLVMESDIEKQNDPFTGLFKKNDNYYYQVVLQEDVEHFMMSGWDWLPLDPMKAEVTAVAKLTVSENGAPEHVTTPEVGEKEQKVFEELKNDNVIVGNWEVQNYYKKSEALREAYKAKFGHDFYVKAWNHFQDLYNHHEINGATYRTETIVIQDSVGTSLKSDVVRTDAAINKINSQSYIYNPNGDPYGWEKLDSINVDFKPEVSLKDPYYLKDWDLQLGYFGGSSPQYKDWPNQYKGSLVNRGNLRIHSSINIEQPYEVRTYSNYDAYSDSPDVAYPDVLWGRIESEPMIYEWNSSLKVAGLSSVRQIILSFNQSNTEKNAEGKYIYRPVILFYDGPERYDTENPLRESKPVIVNMNAPYRGVLYAPNSAVVVIGDYTANFQGFIVAKEYKRLKNTADFEAEMAADSSKYTKKDNYFEENVAVDNPYYAKQPDEYGNDYTSGAYSAEPQTIKWKYTKITENGIEMYVDNYGNVQYMPYPEMPQTLGIYDNFGRTDFTTHGYSVVQESLYNMLVIKK